MFYEPVDLKHKSREKKKARELRHSQWWKLRIQNGECFYCGLKFAAPDLTMDHKIPIGRGGRTTKSNVVPACKPCNSKKQSRTTVEQILG